MLLVDGRGVPLSVMTIEAHVADVNTIETLVDIQVAGKRPKHLLYDRAADADWLRESLRNRLSVTFHSTARMRRYRVKSIPGFWGFENVR